MALEVEGFIESQGVKIHYIANEFDEKKKISLLFVPGIMMPAWIWEKQLKFFSKKYNVVAMDPRSQGDSGQSNDGHFALSMAKDIQTIVETLKLQHLVLIGWSLGVPQVVNYSALLGLKKLIGLVLVDGIVGCDPSLPFYKSMINQWIQFQMDRKTRTEKFIKSIFVQPQSEEYLKKLNEAALRTPTNTVMTLIDNYILQDFRPLLSQIVVPTFIATIDGPRLRYMQEMQKLLPNSCLEIFQAAGHALFVDQPEKFNSSLEKFINNL